MSTLNTDTIISRETYLAFRLLWKTEYRALSEEIRQTKRTVNEQYRTTGYAGFAQAQLAGLRARARSMMADIEVAKEIARNHRQAAAQAA